MRSTSVLPKAWWMPVVGLVAAVLLALPNVVFGNDIGTFLLTALFGIVAVCVLLLLFVVRLRRNAVAGLLMWVTFGVGSLLLMHVAMPVRTWLRWRSVGMLYQQRVLTAPSTKGLKHVEWEGWGFPGAGDTVVYLVYDPINALRAVSGEPPRQVKVASLPCAVYAVHRMQDDWYTVQFYTDTDWDHCE